jgi:hypothetical protein
MGNIQVTQDTAPFLTSTGVVIDVSGTATVTGVVTLFTKKFDVRGKQAFSFFYQASGGATAAWKIFACNDYDPTRPVQKPGSFIDVTADFGAAAAVTPPGGHNFLAALAGTDHFSSWACPYGFVQFQCSQTAGGPETVTAQFFASEV